MLQPWPNDPADDGNVLTADGNVLTDDRNVLADDGNALVGVWYGLLIEAGAVALVVAVIVLLRWLS